MPAAKKEKIITLAVFVFICLFTARKADAQVPGYMGKKFIFSYCPAFTPNITEFVNSSDLPLKLYTKHIFQADYTIGRNVEIGLQGGLMRHFAYREVEPRKVVNWMFKGYSYGVNLKMHVFNDNPVAPLGSSVKFNFQRLHYTLTDENGSYLEEGEIPEKVELDYDGYSFGTGLGVRRIISDRISLEAGLDCNIVFFPDLNNDDNVYHADASYFIFSKNFFTYNLGMGVLLF